MYDTINPVNIKLILFLISHRTLIFILSRLCNFMIRAVNIQCKNEKFRKTIKKIIIMVIEKYTYS